MIMRYDINRFYVSRKTGRRFAITDDCLNATILGVEKYTKKKA